MKAVIYTKIGSKIENIIITKVFYNAFEIAPMIFNNFQEFVEYVENNQLDIIITHCHDNERNYEPVILLLEKIRIRYPNCFLFLTIDYHEDIETYMRDLLNTFTFNYLIKNELGLLISTLVEEIKKEKKPDHQRWILTYKKKITFESTIA